MIAFHCLSFLPHCLPLCSHLSFSRSPLPPAVLGGSLPLTSLHSSSLSLTTFTSTPTPLGLQEPLSLRAGHVEHASSSTTRSHTHTDCVSSSTLFGFLSCIETALYLCHHHTTTFELCSLLFPPLTCRFPATSATLLWVISLTHSPPRSLPFLSGLISLLHFISLSSVHSGPLFSLYMHSGPLSRTCTFPLWASLSHGPLLLYTVLPLSQASFTCSWVLSTHLAHLKFYHATARASHTLAHGHTRPGQRAAYLSHRALTTLATCLHTFCGSHTMTLSLCQATQILHTLCAVYRRATSLDTHHTSLLHTYIRAMATAGILHTLFLDIDDLHAHTSHTPHCTHSHGVPAPHTSLGA